MNAESIKADAHGAARAQAVPSTDGAGAQSRLVIRDERLATAEPLTSLESPKPIGSAGHYDAETYSLERNGRNSLIVAHPVPLESAKVNIAHVDWCAFTLRPSENRSYRWIMSELRRLCGFERFIPRRTGLFGYQASAVIEEAGLIAWGGKHQRGSVYVSLDA